MSPLRAWHFPAGFSIRPEEVGTLSGDGIPAIEFADVSGHRFSSLLNLLRMEREATLVSFPVTRVVTAVGRVARRLLDPSDPIRDRVVETMASFSGYSSLMAERVLNGMAEGWVEDSLWSLLRSEFPEPEVLDGFHPGPFGGGIRALGYPLTLHLGAGSVPGVATTSMIRALLVKSAILLKPGLRDLPLPLAFADALVEADPEFGRALAVVYWPVGDGSRTETALKSVDLVVTYGSDETVRWIRGHLPPSIALRAYRHRMGLGLVGVEALSGGAREAAEEAARGTVMFDQRGCVSPHVFFVERGGEVAPEEFAGLLAQALRELEVELPSGSVSLEEGIAIQQLRGGAEVEEGLGVGKVYYDENGPPWTVVFKTDGALEPSCLNRCVSVLPVDSLDDALTVLRGWASYLQTVGTMGLGDREATVTEKLCRLGVSRVTTLSGMPWPPSWWHHDGSGPLQDLVRWTDYEGPVPLRSDNA